jgi:hypothetical protein
MSEPWSRPVGIGDLTVVIIGIILRQIGWAC